MEHLGMTSLRCRAIRSSSWFTIKLGGKELTPPRGNVIVSRQIGHRIVVESRPAQNNDYTINKHLTIQGYATSVCLSALEGLWIHSVYSAFENQ